MYMNIKDFILKNYKYNCLAEILLTDGKDNPDCLEQFKLQSNKLFQTSSSYQYQIYRKYSEYLSEEIINNFLKYYKIFGMLDFCNNKLVNIFRNELWHDLVANVDKYLSLSNDTSYKYLKSGSCSDVYKIGDYVFKLCNHKYNELNMLCPNNYLILKNLEEKFISNCNNKVVAGFEIQKYLTKDARNVPKEIFTKYEKALLELGFLFHDHFISDRYGDNCMLLDSYKEADCNYLDKLPDWFKEYPLVLVDRDLVVKKKI